MDQAEGIRDADIVVSAPVVAMVQKNFLNVSRVKTLWVDLVDEFDSMENLRACVKAIGERDIDLESPSATLSMLTSSVAFERSIHSRGFARERLRPGFAILRHTKDGRKALVNDRQLFHRVGDSKKRLAELLRELQGRGRARLSPMKRQRVLVIVKQQNACADVGRKCYTKLR